MKTLNNSKYKLMLFVFAIALTSQSCTKNNTESVEGRVLEYGSNKPIPNATVYLMEVKGTFLGPSGSSKIDSTTSDHNGRYKFTYMDNPYVSEIRGKANLYYDNYAYIMGTGKKLKTDLILDPHAWLRIHVKNVNPVDTNDYISLGINTHNCVKGFWGNTIDTIFICDNFKGNRNALYKYESAKTNVGWIKKEINVLLGSKDTTDIQIEY